MGDASSGKPTVVVLTDGGCKYGKHMKRNNASQPCLSYDDASLTDSSLHRVELSVFFLRKLTFIFFFVIGLLCISSILLSSILWTEGYVSFVRRSDERQENIQTMCVQCNVLKLSTPEQNKFLQKLQRVSNKEGDKCCAKTSEQIHILLHMFVERHIRDSAAEGKLDPHNTRGNENHTLSFLGRSGMAAAHVLFDKSKSAETRVISSGKYPIKSWLHTESDFAHAFVRNVRYLEGGRLAVQETGLYYVYGQVYFIKPLQMAHSHSHARSIAHFVYRYSSSLPNGGEELILRHAQSRCWMESNGCLEYTSYVGGVFQLLENDELFVKVSNVDLVHPDSRYTYLGLHSL